MSELRHIGKYQITGLLGTGGQGQVHSAIDAELGREVAIKSLHRSRGDDSANVSRFRSEAKSLARIIHSNITTLIDFFAVDDHLYMIMELVHGRTLDDILQDRGTGLGVRESLAIVAQAADGLGYAHQTGVIHRDIKPSNLMITVTGRVKLMDFGIARVRGSDRLTRVGSAVGTPLYMSPEQCMGADGDERSDIYSLAIVLYELISGTPPFQGKTDHQLSQAHIKTPPPPLVPRIQGVTPAIESAIMKALSKKPEQRFASMRAFSEALGANALLSQATEIIKSHTSLTQTSTSTGDAAGRDGLSSMIIATAKSRSAALIRRFQALHPAVKGMSAGLAGFGVLATVLLQPEPPPAVSKTAQRDTTWQGALSPPASNRPPAIDAALTTGQTAAETDLLRKKPPCVHNTIFVAGSAGCISSIVPVQEPRVPPSPNERPAQINIQPPIERLETPIPVAQPIQVAVSAPEPSISDLRRDFDSQNFGKAFEIAKKLAKFDRGGEGGDREAQFTLGRLFMRGVGGAAKDAMQAFEWFEKSARQGYGNAQYQVGAMYWLGIVAGDQDCRALPWFQKSAEQNVPPALYSVGLLTEKGYCGLSRNIEEAVRYYRSAAEQRNEDAVAALRKMRRL